MLRPVLRSSVILAVLSLLLAGCTLLQSVSTPASSEAIPTGVEEAISPAPPGEASPLPPPVTTPSSDPDSAASTTRYVLVPERSEARYLVREQVGGCCLLG